MNTEVLEYKQICMEQTNTEKFKGDHIAFKGSEDTCLKIVTMANFCGPCPYVPGPYFLLIYLIIIFFQAHTFKNFIYLFCQGS